MDYYLCSLVIQVLGGEAAAVHGAPVLNLSGTLGSTALAAGFSEASGDGCAGIALEGVGTAGFGGKTGV